MPKKSAPAVTLSISRNMDTNLVENDINAKNVDISLFVVITINHHGYIKPTLTTQRSVRHLQIFLSDIKRVLKPFEKHSMNTIQLLEK